MENIIPYIGGEEEKSRAGAASYSGDILRMDVITKAEEPKITCQCIRVPVLNGHTAAVFVNFEQETDKGTAY